MYFRVRQPRRKMLFHSSNCGPNFPPCHFAISLKSADLSAVFGAVLMRICALWEVGNYKLQRLLF